MVATEWRQSDSHFRNTESDSRSFSRRLVVSSHGVLLFQLRFDEVEDLSFAGCGELYNSVQAKKNFVYWRFLHDDPFLGESPNWDLDGPGERLDDGNLGIDVVPRTIELLQPLLVDPRIRFPMMASRWVMNVVAKDATEVSSALLMMIPEYQRSEGLASNGPTDGLTGGEGDIDWYGDFGIAGFGGTSVLCCAGSWEAIQAIDDAFIHVQVRHHHARSLLWHIDHNEWISIERREYDEDELHTLGSELMNATEMQMSVDKALLDVDHANIGFNSTLFRKLIADLYTRFETGRVLDLITDRLAVIDTRNQLLSAVIDRAYQEATRKYSERLQLLFAGAFAAGLLSLIPGLLAVPGKPSAAWYWFPIVVVGLVSVWASVVIVVSRRFSMKADFSGFARGRGLEKAQRTPNRINVTPSGDRDTRPNQ